jgi:hypothetical protein
MEDLMNLISAEDREVFLRNFFKYDIKYYERFIELINDIDKWDKAFQFVKFFFRDRGINPYSRIALKFVTLVHLRFFPKENVYQRVMNNLVVHAEN